MVHAIYRWKTFVLTWTICYNIFPVFTISLSVPCITKINYSACLLNGMKKVIPHSGNSNYISEIQYLILLCGYLEKKKLWENIKKKYLKQNSQFV